MKESVDHFWQEREYSKVQNSGILARKIMKYQESQLPIPRHFAQLFYFPENTSTNPIPHHLLTLYSHCLPCFYFVIYNSTVNHPKLLLKAHCDKCHYRCFRMSISFNQQDIYSVTLCRE